MNVLMVTPHLPPHQAANALLPHLLGQALRERGHGVRFLTFGDGPDSDEVAHVRRRGARLRATRVPQALEAAETWWKTEALLKGVDVVHVHSNTWMNQVAARLCTARRKPYVVTHYGTEIWHHDGQDETFRRLNREARHVAFYSQALHARALELNVPLPAASVVYPPVADAFCVRGDDVRAAERARLGLSPATPLLLNVKRLHPLADQKTLLDAFARIRQQRPEAVLLIAGTGECAEPLQAQARALGLGNSARLLGLVPNEQVAALQAAADLFVLSSTLEATPTVALEALASGTPVVSTDNPGGVELGALFGDDVGVVPKQDPDAFAAAVLAFLAAPRRARPASQQRIASQFRLPGVAERYLEIYREALAA
ncbi:MAG: glycosyltransferase family 4 protein [Vicinamibacteria bacterium]|nr:glycosyltransferase family 4 protein [Vicinamibacteria bacterium]